MEATPGLSIPGFRLVTQGRWLCHTAQEYSVLMFKSDASNPQHLFTKCGSFHSLPNLTIDLNPSGNSVGVRPGKETVPQNWLVQKKEGITMLIWKNFLNYLSAHEKPPSVSHTWGPRKSVQET